MTTITLATESASCKPAIEALLEHAALYDCNWSGAEFEVVIGDYTSIDTDDAIAGVALMSSIDRRIDEVDWALATLHPDVNENEWPEDEEGKLYEFAHCDADGSETVYGLMLWCADAGRAGVMLNSDPTWTDAKSPEDALMRHLSGTMTEAN